MRKLKLAPDVFTFNLMLRAVKETGMDMRGDQTEFLVDVLSASDKKLLKLHMKKSLLLNPNVDHNTQIGVVEEEVAKINIFVEIPYTLT